MTGYRPAARLPRTLHPGAWWLWALGLAAAASRTTNPLLLGLILAAAGCVVACRRGNAPWALAFRWYLWLGAFVVVMRIVYRVIFGGGDGATVLIVLPSLQLPAWAAGIRLFGTVSVEAVLAGFYDGLRLATMIVCLGAANALANPKRLLKAVPPALYEVGTAVVVALTVVPQLAESARRVTAARRLRGGTARGTRAVARVIVPVLADALDRSLLLARSMDSRGYGRAGTVSLRVRRRNTALLLLGLLGVCAGVYGWLDASSPAYLGVPLLVAGVALAVGGFVLAGQGVRRTRYRPDPWRAAETATAACGLAAAVLIEVIASVTPWVLHPSLFPPAWPQLPPLAVGAALLAALPAVLTPRPISVGAAVTSRMAAMS